MAAVVRRTGDALGGLQVRRCSIELVEDPAPASNGSTDISTEAARVPSDVRVSLRVSIGADVSIPSLAEEVRRAVIAVVEREVGMNVIVVDVVVEDVHGV